MQIQLKKHHGRYSKYKQTGIPWLGEVPEEWEVKKLNLAYAFEKGQNAQVFTAEYISDENNIGEYPVYSGQTENDGVMGMINAYIYDREFSIFVTTVGGKVMTPMFIKGKFSLSQNCALFRARNKKKICDKYFFYQLFPLFEMEKANIPSHMQPSLRISDLNRYIVAFPHIVEQKNIAQYLDLKIDLVDQLIASKQNQINLLQNKRTSLIYRAVTLGIDERVGMKESGVEWIGKIPMHWQLMPLFTIAKEQQNKNIGNKIDNVLSLSYGKIIRRDVENNFGLLPESFETYQIVDSGNIILRLTDLQNDKRSLRVGLVKERGIITSAYVCLSVKKQMLSDYLYVLLHSYDLEKVFYNLGAGVRQTMKFSDLKRLPIPLPPIQEQQRIVDFLNSETRKIDRAVAIIKQSISFLEEYKTSLISHVVTGKIKVTNS